MIWLYQTSTTTWYYRRLAGRQEWPWTVSSYPSLVLA